MAVQVVAASLGAMVETYIAPTAAAPSKKPFVITVMTRDTDTGGDYPTTTTVRETVYDDCKG